jgi:hypothetical protein
MAEPNTVATPVPAPDWASELQKIATRADALERNPDALLADRLDLATAAFSRLWLAWSPQVIARSCRASARLFEPVLVVAADLDQQLQVNQSIRMAALLNAGQLERPAQIEPVLPSDDEEELEVIAAPKRRRRSRVADQCPPGWLVPDEVAKRIGCSGSKVRRDICAGAIPSEMLHKVGRRSQWLDPAVVEFLAKKKNPPGRASGGFD